MRRNPSPGPRQPSRQFSAMGAHPPPSAPACEVHLSAPPAHGNGFAGSGIWATPHPTECRGRSTGKRRDRRGQVPRGALPAHASFMERRAEAFRTPDRPPTRRGVCPTEGPCSITCIWVAPMLPLFWTPKHHHRGCFLQKPAGSFWMMMENLIMKSPTELIFGEIINYHDPDESRDERRQKVSSESGARGASEVGFKGF